MKTRMRHRRALSGPAGTPFGSRDCCGAPCPVRRQRSGDRPAHPIRTRLKPPSSRCIVCPC